MPSYSMNEDNGIGFVNPSSSEETVSLSKALRTRVSFKWDYIFDKVNCSFH